MLSVLSLSTLTFHLRWLMAVIPISAKYKNTWLSIFLGLSLYVSAVSGSDTAGEGVHIHNLISIHIPANAGHAEQSMAKMLQKRLRELYGIRLTIHTVLPRRLRSVILVGREPAVESHMMTEEEIEAVKYDGYVIKAFGDHVALAGYGPEGTIYAAHEFLRKIGLKTYPWQPTGGLEIFTPLKDGFLEPFSKSGKPFFQYRDILSHRGRGRFGASTRMYSLGDLRFTSNLEYYKDRGYLSWDHTAGYLVPMARYGAIHPEYFSQTRAADLVNPTPNHDVALCMCEPDVSRIATENLLQWMELQPDRRYFAVTNGDKVSRCGQCDSSDPIPDFYTDQMLRWVNAVARAVADKHPDKTLLTNAYQKSVKPPVNTAPEPNVLVMYGPWFWQARATSAVGLAHPMNITAMEEFMGWSMLFPGQMAVYDYPQKWVYGTSERIKFFAKNNVRWMYLNGPQGNLLHWIASQLLWDPFLDTRLLEREFLQAVYGPASIPLEKYQRLRQETLRRTSQYTMSFFTGSDFLSKAGALLERAEVIAQSVDPDTRARIQMEVADRSYEILKYGRTGDMSISDLRQAFRRYVQLQRKILLDEAQQDRREDAIKRRIREFETNLSALVDQKRPGTHQKWTSIEELNAMIQRYTNGFEETLVRVGRKQSLFPLDPPKIISARFAETEDVSGWLTASSQRNLVTVPRVVKHGSLGDETFSGVQVQAPLSRLPVVTRGNIRVHAGRFHVTKSFDPPLSGRGLPFLDLRIYASRQVPVTVYLNERWRLKSDIDLYPGEQIVRIDLRNFLETRVNVDTWDGKIDSVAFDIWPQDNFYPYPAGKDIELVFEGIQLKNQNPSPVLLPYRGKAIWMTHFRANIPHGPKIINDIAGNYQRQTGRADDYRNIVQDYTRGRVNERYRSFTEHRAITPIFAILTGRSEDLETVKAANIMQEFLDRSFHVHLPIDPAGVAVTPDTGNVIVIGREAALESGGVSEKELAHAGRDGFVIRARDGRVIVAGGNGMGTLSGVVRYLEDHGIRFRTSDAQVYVPDNSNGLLHELYLVDWPYFRERPYRCGNILTTEPIKKPPEGRISDHQAGLKAAGEIVDAIKDLARRGATVIPAEIGIAAEASHLSCYLAARLMWDPFADASWLVQEFNRGGDSQTH